MKLVIDISKELYKRIKSYGHVETLAEKLIANGKVLPENATNGDVIEAILPNHYVDFKQADKYTVATVMVYIEGDVGNGRIQFTQEWWKAPYKKETKE